MLRWNEVEAGTFGWSAAVSSSAVCTQHASDSAEEASAQAAGRLGFSGPGGSVSGRMQRAVYGVDLATDAGPVAVL